MGATVGSGEAMGARVNGWWDSSQEKHGMWQGRGRCGADKVGAEREEALPGGNNPGNAEKGQDLGITDRMVGRWVSKHLPL